ncbi:rod shape determining protein RodA [Thermosyntropha lipolytica DSM 11003]|uniref:Peptidoglycan glycosyltransferase RodA n=1 Tax=Thermosyntropha lipolytica DSM 11003 TaxID=1123382 RepID=A0A1M5MNR5_9FIRM|nr:rod shape-determining protein RodA [Thermosyntropha lipolytica]SHG78682.1 rod shape determining protein RodA [Thermosyntropha lipolytica DSM 11003]
MELKRLKFIDKSFVFAWALLMALGLVVLFSASSGMASDSYFYVKKQLAAIFIGLLLAFFIMQYDYTQFSRYSWILYGIAVVMLLAVLVLGQEVRGTTGWISIGPLPPVQPAEFTKVLVILAFADFINRRKSELHSLKGIMLCLLYIGVPFGLIMLQPDLGTGLVYIAFTLVMLLIAGANPRIIWTLVLGALTAAFIMIWMHFQFGTWLPLEDYQIKRLLAFIDPYNDGQGGRGFGWNTIQSLIAIGSGGLTGKGLFNGTQVQLNFLPEHHTDFIYAVIGEELGFIGAAIVIILYGVLILRSVYISYSARDLYGTLVVAGISAMWLFHVFENIGMSIGIMPITGIPLPFVSYGGSSMLTNIVAVGLILSVNIRGKKIVF